MIRGKHDNNNLLLKQSYLYNFVINLVADFALISTP